MKDQDRIRTQGPMQPGDLNRSAAFFIAAFLAIGTQSAPSAKADEHVFLNTGKRLLVQASGRSDYTPRIVNCDTSSIELCIRDTDGSPPNNPLEPTDDGNLRVTFESWGVSYEIKPDGTGTAFDSENNELGPFTWEMVPE